MKEKYLLTFVAVTLALSGLFYGIKQVSDFYKSKGHTNEVVNDEALRASEDQLDKSVDSDLAKKILRGENTAQSDQPDSIEYFDEGLPPTDDFFPLIESRVRVISGEEFDYSTYRFKNRVYNYKSVQKNTDIGYKNPNTMEQDRKLINLH